MLSEQEKQQIDAEIAHYPYRQGASIEALKIVQKHRGWISDEAIEDIAAYLQMSPAQLDSVATFYNLIFRKPVGEHVILLCDSVSCWICGYQQIQEHLKKSLGIDFGETTADNKFTLLPIQCLGTCDHAPALMIDEKLYQNVDPAALDKILQQYQGGEEHGTTSDS